MKFTVYITYDATNKSLNFGPIKLYASKESVFCEAATIGNNSF